MASNDHHHDDVHNSKAEVIHAIPTAIIIPPAPRYKECMKNHTIINEPGEQKYHTLDGCCEFISAGPEGSAEFLICLGCGCNRSFHRLEELDSFYPAPYVSFMRSPPFCTPSPPPTPVPSGCVRSTQTQMQLSLLALPSPGSQTEEKSNLNGGGVVEVVSSSGVQRRTKTKFTLEQQIQMHAMAEVIGWKFRGASKKRIQQFCDEVGVKRDVFRSWTHNHKTKTSSNGVDN